MAAMPLPRLVDSASSKPRSLRNTGSVATISAGARPEYTRSSSATRPETMAASDAPAKLSTGPCITASIHTLLWQPGTRCASFAHSPGNGGRARPSSMMKP